LFLDERDSGTEQFQIVYAAQIPGTVSIAGGCKIPFSKAKNVSDPKIINRIINPLARAQIRQVNLKNLGIHNYGRNPRIPSSLRQSRPRTFYR
ncbi:hypothetical protein N9M57_04940, partial [Opitutales bacterium]|nr:hypothetical protein [Opitutales bacterium]